MNPRWQYGGYNGNVRQIDATTWEAALDVGSGVIYGKADSPDKAIERAKQVFTERMEPEKKQRKSSMAGIWFMYPIDQGIPDTVTIYSGSVQGRKSVRTISKMQALGLARWHRHPGLYYSYRDGNGNWRDVRVVGDIDAWHGQPE